MQPEIKMAHLCFNNMQKVNKIKLRLNIIKIRRIFKLGTHEKKQDLYVM